MSLSNSRQVQCIFPIDDSEDIFYRNNQLKDFVAWILCWNSCCMIKHQNFTHLCWYPKKNFKKIYLPWKVYVIQWEFRAPKMKIIWKP